MEGIEADGKGLMIRGWRGLKRTAREQKQTPETQSHKVDGREGKYRSSVDAREPQNPTQGEEGVYITF